MQLPFREQNSSLSSEEFFVVILLKAFVYRTPARLSEIAHHAGKLVSCSSDLNEIKSLEKKIGTNRPIKDKKILFDFVPPYHNIPKYKALQTKSPAGAGLGGEVSKKETLAWWSPLTKNRTFYSKKLKF
jgi:hypothetical protein